MAPKVKAKKSAKRPVTKPKQPAQRAGRTSTSRLSSKNQLTVPVDILRRVGLEAGDEVEFVVNDAGFIEVKPVIEENPLLQLAGIGAGIYDDFDLAKDRESWSRPWDL